MQLSGLFDVNIEITIEITVQRPNFSVTLLFRLTTKVRSETIV